MIEFSVRKNVTFFHLIKSHFSYLESFLLYKKSFKNYFTVIVHVLKKKYPVKGILKDGEQVILNNHFDVFSVARGKNKKYKIDNKGNITLFTNNVTVKLQTHNDFGGVYSSFLNDTWKINKMKDKNVIDIGAYLGDSSISFAINGAKKVIALEPLPQNFNIAKKNIEQNNLGDKIELMFAACGSKDEFMSVDPSVSSSHQVSLKRHSKGIKIPVISLKQILEKFGSEPSVLKMNCEGCEYDVILASTNEVLKKLEYIVIEYHYGYKNLKEKLELAGFTVTITSPIYSLNRKTENPHMYIGKIYATKID